MEYILAAIFSSNRILYSFASVDLFYIFSLGILIFYISRRRKAISEILRLTGIFTIYTILVAMIAENGNLLYSGGFLIAMIFNLTLLVYIVRDRYKWSMLRWSLAMATIHGVETVVALLRKDQIRSSLWEVKEHGEMTFQKLRLFYHEPAVLCFVSGVLLIYFIYKLVTDGISIQIVLGALVALGDMYYSFSLGGIIAAAIAIAVLLAVNLTKIAKGKVTVIDKSHSGSGASNYGIQTHNSIKSSIRWTIIVIAIGVISAIAFIVSPIYSARLRSLFEGNDASLNYTVKEPVSKLITTLSQTGGRGSGIGYSGDIMNSFLRTITEGGITGLVLIAATLVTLLCLCVKYGGALDAALLTYIVLFQMTAGEFTNPVNWFIYGWIIADCFGQKELLREKSNPSDNIENDDVPVTVGIIGAKGLNNYGGYETFVDKLTEYHQNKSNIKYLIACKANGQGEMDESKLDGAVPINSWKFIYHNAYCFKIKVPQVGSGQAIIYDLLSAVYVINYFKRHRVEKPILYVLTCRIGPFMRFISNAVHDLGGVYYLNPDGHEFLRAYWSRPVRAYWKYSEKLMVKYADKVICDSKNIETYISAGYEQYSPNTTYIPYGTDLVKSTLDNDDPKFTEWMNGFDIKPKEYYLIVGRFVPENNYETMLREFIKSDTKKDLVIITNVNDGFLGELEEKLSFKKDKRIKFVGTVYDQDLLKKIREEAFAYMHGHEVGGTNPSLIEALGSTKLNILLNVGFNRECGEEGALYFSKEEDDLMEVINNAEKMTEEEIEEISKLALKRVKKDYSWIGVAEKYEKLFTKRTKFKKRQ